MSNIDFTTINKIIRGIRGSARHAEFEKNAQEFVTSYRVAKEKLSIANKMEHSSILPMRTIEWYGEFNTENYISLDDTPTIVEMEMILKEAKNDYDNWVNKTIGAIEFAKELANDYAENGVPRDHRFIIFANDRAIGGDIVQFIPTEKEKENFAKVKETARNNAKDAIKKIEISVSELEKEVKDYSASWFASPEYTASKLIIRELDEKNGRIRNCKTLADFLKIFPNPTTEEVAMFDKSR